MALRTQLQHQVAAIVRSPDIVVPVDVQSVRVGEHIVAKTAKEFAVSSYSVSMGLARCKRKMWPLEFNATPEASPTFIPS